MNLEPSRRETTRAAQQDGEPGDYGNAHRCALQSRMDAPIHCQMDEGIWTYRRGDERLALSREATAASVNLMVSDRMGERSYAFGDPVRLINFQADMESFLLRTSWSFVGFTPDRRDRPDRRLFLRLTERRRWWTDGAPDQWPKNSRSCSGIRNPSNT